MASETIPVARYEGNGKCRFCVWAPIRNAVELHIVSAQERFITLDRDDRGYYSATATDVHPGDLYFYRLDREEEFPDPASRFQPQGVHGPSQVMSSEYAWKNDAWRGIPLKEYILYELHVGSFTPEGTFDGVEKRVAELRDLGVTALEIMPVAQFPGERNWGYDGVYPFAVQNSYGGPEGLKRLVDACHGAGLAAVLDVVYNHLGPEGSYLSKFGPYFTSRYHTPWGDAVNFDGPYSDEVRRYFIQNALYWLEEFRFDALRLDAIHGILDFSAKPFLEELSSAVHDLRERTNRHIYLIAECDRNDSRVTLPGACGGYGIDAQWNDDFHHALHVLLTSENQGYYADFGSLTHMAKAYREGFVYSGQYSIFRQRSHGIPSTMLTGEQLVVCSQNHDQVGNRLLGDRLTSLVPEDALRLAAGAVILSPFIPLLFMGEEYGEKAPFQYFVSHSDPDLVRAVREGRKMEFEAFRWQGECPDPQSQAIFQTAQLTPSLKEAAPHDKMYAYYRKLIDLRKTVQSLADLDKESMEVTEYEAQNVLVLRRWALDDEVIEILHFSASSSSITLQIPSGTWNTILDSGDPVWGGHGISLDDEFISRGEIVTRVHPYAFIVLRKMRSAV
ncbi:malto-oligosyltrehalose trehalohydrolase [Desulfomonile tiedjei]|uniref:Malto-oligosyltrehalose trehalohydrolase n=1 Tax=Desulfomonile tiedjei (strain ATCC 49306 / DSM 6799 / DCB-1) TaxID=706587 RepID=I4C6F2_DESTA|nr:malto-oligosyltrehalose trehalohydrolase [Desulfomonile tiedjei]AFM25143.1 maltooligosyl trehalose hydrolase [Desulfomonile tiedjei DSM 6799]